MKRYGNLYPKICEWENIYNAYLKARKCKRYRPDVLQFTEKLEDNLFRIYKELKTKLYEVGPYKKFTIYEPKEREIFSLSFKDRVVQHAIVKIIEPIFEKTFISDTYACRINKGTHAGLKRLQKFIQNEKPGSYFLKADIKKYFQSIDKEILKDKIREKIKCNDTLNIIDKIIDSNSDSPGIPIGNLTSQLFANYYLCEIDHFIKEKLREARYIRYMDDFVIISNDLKRLKYDLEEIRKKLKEIKLDLNKKTSIGKIKQGIDFLGYRTWPNVVKLRKRNIKKNRRKFKKFGKQIINGKDYILKTKQSIGSLGGYSKNASCKRTVESIMKGLIMPIKMKFDEKSGNIVTLPGMWVPEQCEIQAEKTKKIREQISLEEEISIIRDIVVKNHIADLPENYAKAVDDAKSHGEKIKNEAEAYMVLMDEKKWTAENTEKLLYACKIIGFKLTAEKIEDISAEIKSKIKNLNDIKQDG